MTAQHFISLLPLIWLVFALVKLKWKAHWAILSALVLALVLALSIWHLPVGQAATSILEGAISAVWPIFLIILSAMLVYDLSVRTGGMESIKNMLAGVSNDKRILALIIIWGFGGFMEGMAGFGTAVAIPAAMMVALGVPALTAAVAAMVANAMPTAFGAVGIPTITLAQITRLDLLRITFASSLQMAPIVFLIPFIVVFIIGGGFRALRGMIIPCLVAALSLLLPQLIMAATVGPELGITVPALISMVAL
ncbi:MAG: L-lactate permease, partial [Cellulomonadaceae bacterium]|nr:L-lactate permease [Cellulomonadaceae bacterium]